MIRLVYFDEADADNYAEQRRAAHARAQLDGGRIYTGEVATEVTRLEPAAEMDIEVVKGIVDRELQRQNAET